MARASLGFALAVAWMLTKYPGSIIAAASKVITGTGPWLADGRTSSADSIAATAQGSSVAFIVAASS